MPLETFSANCLSAAKPKRRIQKGYVSIRHGSRQTGRAPAYLQARQKPPQIAATPCPTDPYAIQKSTNFSNPRNISQIRLRNCFVTPYIWRSMFFSGTANLPIGSARVSRPRVIWPSPRGLGPRA
jgi:hypothetical protein